MLHIINQSLRRFPHRVTIRHCWSRHSLVLSSRAGKQTISVETPPPPPSVHNVLIAVDPDTRGAIAAAVWKASPSRETESDDGTLETVDIATLTWHVYDMPCATVTLMKKSKISGKPAIRRTIDIHAAKMVVEQSMALAKKSSPNLHLRAYIESPPIIPSDSALSTASLSYTHGVWHGLLSMRGFTAGSVPTRAWKRDLGLWRLDKDASRMLAVKVFPQMRDLLLLKKHHGRAEALLIAAWGLGLSVDKDTQEISFGPMRSCSATDAYGNAVNFSTLGHVADPDATHSPESCPQPLGIYADAKTLHDIKLASIQDKQDKKVERAARKKVARKAAKKALKEVIEADEE